MKTIISKIDERQIDMDTIDKAGRVIRAGGLVAFPTETVYGLGADALNPEAAEKIYAAKGRPSDNPLIIHVADIQSLDDIILNPPDVLAELAYRFWPGPLTLIFEKSPRVPYETTGGLDTVAVRLPENLVARELIIAGGGYIAAPSANTSGRPSPTAAAHVIADMDGRIDMILDGGNVEIGVESTILDMTVSPPAILRPGAITCEMLMEVLPLVNAGVSTAAKYEAAPKAPGMKYRHYAPKAPLMIVEGSPAETVNAIKQMTYDQKRKNKKVGIIAVNETGEYYNHGIVKTIGARENEKAIAKNLYTILREFDDEKVDYIYSESFSREGIGQAIMNRLSKAAGHRIIAAEEITRQQKYRRILFVGGGDTCRGPMASMLLRTCVLEQEYEIASRGMIVLFPEPVNAKAGEVMRRKGKSLDGFEATPFSAVDIQAKTLILTMEESQKRKILSEYENAEHIFTLQEYAGETGELKTVYGQPLEEYERLYHKLEIVIEKIASRLNEEVQNL